jgi:hypothetical protein
MRIINLKKTKKILGKILFVIAWILLLPVWIGIYIIILFLGATKYLGEDDYDY